MSDDDAEMQGVEEAFSGSGNVSAGSGGRGVAAVGGKRATGVGGAGSEFGCEKLASASSLLSTDSSLPDTPTCLPDRGAEAPALLVAGQPSYARHLRKCEEPWQKELERLRVENMELRGMEGDFVELGRMTEELSCWEEECRGRVWTVLEAERLQHSHSLGLLRAEIEELAAEQRRQTEAHAAHRRQLEERLQRCEAHWQGEAAQLRAEIAELRGGGGGGGAAVLHGAAEDGPPDCLTSTSRWLQRSPMASPLSAMPFQQPPPYFGCDGKGACGAQAAAAADSSSSTQAATVAAKTASPCLPPPHPALRCGSGGG